MLSLLRQLLRRCCLLSSKTFSNVSITPFTTVGGFWEFKISVGTKDYRPLIIKYSFSITRVNHYRPIYRFCYRRHTDLRILCVKILIIPLCLVFVLPSKGVLEWSWISYDRARSGEENGTNGSVDYWGGPCRN